MESRWWHVYGHFPAGEGDMPHAGKVIAHYRELQGWDAVQLGNVLGLQKRQVFNIERSPALPEPLSRREIIVKALNIPPVLLGVLAWNTAPGQLFPFAEPEPLDVLPASTLQAYEGTLSLAWEAYYTSSAQKSAAVASLWLTHLNDSLSIVKSVAGDQLRALLCRFHQLAGVIARDRLDFTLALAHADTSLELALHLRNAELITSSLIRRARTHIERKAYEAAVKDLERALSFAHRTRDPLRSYTAICLAEAYSLYNPTNIALQKKSLALLDDVAKTVRARGILQGDGSFTKVDAAGLFMVRGDVFRRQGQLEESENALLIVREQLPKNQTRWAGNLCIADALLCQAQGDIDGACTLALDTLDILAETHSSATRAKVERLSIDLQARFPRHLQVRALAARLHI